MKKRVKLTALFCTAVLLVSSVLSPASATVQAKAKKPALSKKKVTITLGKTAKLKVKQATGCKITWKSKKKKVVTVKKSGKYAAKLTAKKKGTAKVIATVKKGKKRYKLTCKVKVVLAKADSSATPAATPTQTPTVTPTQKPDEGPAVTPTQNPTVAPTQKPDEGTTVTPTQNPTVAPTQKPDEGPAVTPTQNPTVTPTQKPDEGTTVTPTQNPTVAPTQKPDEGPTATPAQQPTVTPTQKPDEGPTATPTQQPTVTPTPVPVVTPTPAPEDKELTLSAETFLTSAAMNGTPIYNGDGSVTVTLTKNYGGGGVVFSIDESKTPVDLSNYEKVIFTLSADAETPLTISAYRSSNFWDSTAETGSIVLSYKNATTEKTDYSFELTNLNGVIGFGVRYNASGQSVRDEVTLTIHSITLVKDTRDISDAVTNYSSLAELAAKYGLKMGTVMNDQKVKNQKYGDLMKYHFNSITAANEMKAYSMLDEGASKEAAKSDANAMPVVNFTSADAIMDFAKENGLNVRGHALVWDAGMKDWFFRVDYDTSQPYASADVVKARLKNYIQQVLTHFEQKYPGIIYCWDVVNEAVGDNASEYAAGDLRHVRTKRSGASNPFYDIIGSDYVELSFQYTYETLQENKNTYPSMKDIKLYYNDYNTFYAEKRDAICELVNAINNYKPDDNGGYVKLCDGVGMQSYIGGFGTQDGCMNESNINQVKTAILKFADQGVKVQVTELAVRNYQSDAETTAKHGDFYKKLFQAYLDVNSGDEKPLEAISIWGIVDIPDLPEDDYSFTMNGPYCGLFTETLAVKPAFVNIHDLMKNGQ